MTDQAPAFSSGHLPGTVEVFEGDATDIGAAMGARGRKPDLVPDWRPRLGFALACRDIVAGAYPEAVARADAAARAGGYDPDEFVVWYFTHHAVTPFAPDACVGLCAAGEATADGLPLAARNYHWTTADAGWRCLRVVRRSGARFTVAGYTHHWTGLSDAMNSAGLFVAIHAVKPVPAKRAGFTWHVAVDMVLETCATVREAADLLASLPHIRPFSYMVADAGGECASVEAAPCGVAVRGPQGGVLVVSNHFADGSWQPGSTPEPSPTSLARFEVTSAFLRRHAGAIDERLVARLLASHESSLCLGSHSEPGCPAGEPGREEWATLWSIIARPRRRSFAVAPGPPCVTPFHRLDPPDLGFAPQAAAEP